MIDGYALARKALAARKVPGCEDLARHLARWARKLGFHVPPKEFELPALTGFSEDDLKGLGIRCRRTRDGLAVIRRGR